MSEFVFNFETLRLSPDIILSEMGYGKIRPGKEVKNTLYAVFDKIAPFTSACVYRLLEGEAGTSTVILENGMVMNVGPVIGRLLKGSVRFSVFAATAGTDFHAYLERTKAEGNMLEVFMLDTIGSSIVEKTGDRMELMLQKEMAGYSCTNRFSPGYCGWALSEQKSIFHLLGEHPCGLSLSETFLMSPLKSISGIIGVGMNLPEKKYGCGICELKSCYKRKRI